MALTATTQIMKAFCKQEIFGEATDLIQFLVDSADATCPIQFGQTAELDDLEDKAVLLADEEPDQYLNYDAWLEWKEKSDELEAKIDEASAQAALATFGINEWYLCSKRLGDKLKEHGEYVVYYNDFAIWGRETFTVDVEYDMALKDIAAELEILPGMSHDWSKHLKIET